MRDYIDEMSRLQTDGERIVWLASLNDDERAEIRRWMKKEVTAAERWLEEALAILRLAAGARTHREFIEMLPQVELIISRGLSTSKGPLPRLP